MCTRNYKQEPPVALFRSFSNHFLVGGATTALGMIGATTNVFASKELKGWAGEPLLLGQTASRDRIH